MNHFTHRSLAALGAASLLGVLASAIPAQQPAVGEKIADFELHSLINGDGRTKLSEFYGSPVLFEFWGTR